MELEVFVDQIVREPRGLQSAVVTATGFAKPQSCLDDDTLRRLPAPPSPQHDEVRAVRLELARADAIARAGDYAEALQVVRAGQLRARDLEWAPLLLTLQRRDIKGTYDIKQFAAFLPWQGDPIFLPTDTPMPTLTPSRTPIPTNTTSP
jgi:hypothetical protein